jgi:hypothetical protein
MRKIVNSTYISLDGVLERPPEWPSVVGRGSKGDQIQTELLLGDTTLENGVVILAYRTGTHVAA